MKRYCFILRFFNVVVQKSFPRLQLEMDIIVLENGGSGEMK